MFSYFQSLATLVRTKWLCANRDLAAFSDVAADSLEELPPSEYLNINNVVRDISSHFSELPNQTDPLGLFSEPPITIINEGDFCIDLHFWLDDIPSIHEHSFSGAFLLIHGAALHSKFTFTPSRTVDALLTLGNLNTSQVILLRPGNIIRIDPGPSFIHALFHITRPTVTLVIRTTNHAVEDQRWYSRPTLSFANNSRFPQYYSKHLRLLDTIGASDPSQLQDLLYQLAQKEMSGELVRFILHARNKFERNPDYLAELLNSIQFDSDDIQEALIAALKADSFDSYLLSMRTLLDSPDERCFIGSVLLAPTVSEIAPLCMDWIENKSLSNVVDILTKLALRGIIDRKLASTNVTSQLARILDPSPKSNYRPLDDSNTIDVIQNCPLTAHLLSH